jgi:hypothetical protein
VIGDLVLDDAGGDDGAENAQRQQGQDDDRDEVKEKLDPDAAVLQKGPPWRRFLS